MVESGSKNTYSGLFPAQSLQQGFRFSGNRQLCFRIATLFSWKILRIFSACLPRNDRAFARPPMIQSIAQNEVFSGPLFFKKRGGFAFQERDVLPGFFPGKPPLFLEKSGSKNTSSGLFPASSTGASETPQQLSTFNCQLLPRFQCLPKAKPPAGHHNSQLITHSS